MGDQSVIPALSWLDLKFATALGDLQRNHLQNLKLGLFSGVLLKWNPSIEQLKLLHSNCWPWTQNSFAYNEAPQPNTAMHHLMTLTGMAEPGPSQSWIPMFQKQNGLIGTISDSSSLGLEPTHRPTFWQEIMWKKWGTFMHAQWSHRWFD